MSVRAGLNPRHVQEGLRVRGLLPEQRARQVETWALSGASVATGHPHSVSALIGGEFWPSAGSPVRHGAELVTNMQGRSNLGKPLGPRWLPAALIAGYPPHL